MPNEGSDRLLPLGKASFIEYGNYGTLRDVWVA